MSAEQVPPVVQDNDDGVTDYGSMFDEAEKHVSGGAAPPADPKPASAAPAAPAAPPAAAPATPPAEGAKPPAAPAEPAAPASPDDWMKPVEWKDEEGEKNEDVVALLKTPEGRKRIREVWEKGNAFDRVLPRREDRAIATAFKQMQEQVAQDGYDLSWDAQAQRVRIARKAGQEATPPAPSSPGPQTADVATLRARRAALAKDVAEGYTDAIVEDNLLRDQIHEAEMAALRNWQTQVEQERAAVQQRQFEANLTEFGNQCRTARQASFSGLDDAEYRSLVKSLAAQSKTWEELQGKLNAYADRLDRAVQARIAKMTGSPQPGARGPAPAAPPAMAGSPPAAGGATVDRSKLKTSTFGGAAYDKELDEFFDKS